MCTRVQMPEVTFPVISQDFCLPWFWKQGLELGHEARLTYQ